MTNKKVTIGDIWTIDIDAYKRLWLEYMWTHGFDSAISPELVGYRNFNSIIIYDKMPSDEMFYAELNNGQMLTLNGVHPDCLIEKVGFDPSVTTKAKGILSSLKYFKDLRDAALLLEDHYRFSDDDPDLMDITERYNILSDCRAELSDEIDALIQKKCMNSTKMPKALSQKR